MAQADVVAAAKATYLSAQDGALTDYGNACYAGGKAEAGAGGFTQTDIDNAVAAQKTADAQALSDLAAKESMEADLLAKIKAVLGISA